MKSEPKENQVFLDENTDSKITSKKVIETNSYQSSIENPQNIKIISIDNSNKPTTLKDFFKPKDLYFKEHPSYSKSTPSISYQSLIDIKMSQIDPAFLDALPADLRQELENELKANEFENVQSVQRKKPTMDVTMTEESCKLYQHVPVEQMKEFVEEWVNTENEPKLCDNVMVSEYLCNLVKDAKTEDAYEIIRKLYR